MQSLGGMVIYGCIHPRRVKDLVPSSSLPAVGRVILLHVPYSLLPDSLSTCSTWAAIVLAPIVVARGGLGGGGLDVFAQGGLFAMLFRIGCSNPAKCSVLVLVLDQGQLLSQKLLLVTWGLVAQDLELLCSCLPTSPESLSCRMDKPVRSCPIFLLAAASARSSCFLLLPVLFPFYLRTSCSGAFASLQFHNVSIRSTTAFFETCCG